MIKKIKTASKIQNYNFRTSSLSITALVESQKNRYVGVSVFNE